MGCCVAISGINYKSNWSDNMKQVRCLILRGRKNSVVENLDLIRDSRTMLHEPRKSCINTERIHKK